MSALYFTSTKPYKTIINCKLINISLLKKQICVTLLYDEIKHDTFCRFTAIPLSHDKKKTRKKFNKIEIIHIKQW